MSVHRRAGGDDACPLDEVPITMDVCQSCIYFRGAAKYPLMKRDEYSITCNWPRNGSEVAQVPIPAVFLKAFGGE